MAASDYLDDNILVRITEWVEKGNLLEYIWGTKFVKDIVALGKMFLRKHCKFPKVHRYVGKGDGPDEEGWKCV